MYSRIYKPSYIYDEELDHQLIRVGNPCGESNSIISPYKMLLKKKKQRIKGYDLQRRNSTDLYPGCISYSFIRTVHIDKSILQLYIFAFNVVSLLI